MHKWEPDFYIGFSPALHFCSVSIAKEEDLTRTAATETNQIGGRKQ
jgi:hypothetical protein